MSGAVRGVALAVALVACGSGDPSSHGAPDPPPPERLLRDGTRLTLARTADLDGDGVLEVVVAARANEAEQFQHPSQYLDLYRYRDGGWDRTLAGTEQAPPGAETPGTMLDPPGEELVGRLVDVVEVVDFARDGAPELVVGILTVGAGPGPLELWVLSMADGALRTDLYERTTRDGNIQVRGDTIVLEFGVYRPSDPGCCPSRIERQVIGWDDDAVAVLERDRRPA